MTAAQEQLGWWVLLLGGGSGAGKTEVARRLARRLGISCLLVDDIRQAPQRVTNAHQQPALHVFFDPALGERQPSEAIWARSPEVLCEGLVGVGRVMSEAIQAVIDHHIHLPGAGPIVIEGDGILPDAAARRVFAQDRTRGQVRAAFLYEPDEEALLAQMHGRGRGFQQWSGPAQRTQIRMSWLFGRWLREGARARGLPVLEARPWETLDARLLRAIAL